MEMIDFVKLFGPFMLVVIAWFFHMVTAKAKYDGYEAVIKKQGETCDKNVAELKKEHSESIENLKTKQHTLRAEVLTNKNDFVEYKLEVEKNYVNKEDNNRDEEKRDKLNAQIFKELKEIRGMIGSQRSE